MIDRPAQDSPPKEKERGIECLNCGCRHFEVIRTCQREDKIVRRRACRNCGREITTTERRTG